METQFFMTVSISRVHAPRATHLFQITLLFVNDFKQREKDSMSVRFQNFANYEKALIPDIDRASQPGLACAIAN